MADNFDKTTKEITILENEIKAIQQHRFKIQEIHQNLKDETDKWLRPKLKDIIDKLNEHNFEDLLHQASELSGSYFFSMDNLQNIIKDCEAKESELLAKHQSLMKNRSA